LAGVGRSCVRKFLEAKGGRLGSISSIGTHGLHPPLPHASEPEYSPRTTEWFVFTESVSRGEYGVWVTYRIELKADHIAGIRIDGIRVVCKVPAGPDGDGVRLGSLGGDRGACGR
jgi:hypothetical protein